ncbi:lysosome membrane protein 2 [Drosophila grimshawi]|uniref:GH22041 n=1 Tax=Drosophila grimshawi TaxID=7222 RepID=B4J9L9_DROGR|nr:lysosome membrane protein 2 [Drosophila grimshawi]EDW02526.1 GH22041 [Drosophila grimshawi]
MANCCCWFKIAILSLFCVLNIVLFVISCRISYQHAMTQEHTRFRQQMPTMDSWVNSPFGKLKSYLFNVTNAEAFLDGRDSKIKLQEVGPITYGMLGYNDILNRTGSSVTYSKERYRQMKFLPEESVSPDILNKTIIQFNSVLLGSAIQVVHNYPFALRVFNALTIGEPVFLSNSVNYFLWEYTRPSLKLLSSVMPLDTNCGLLFNALKKRKEVYKVNIGTEHGIDNFFRIQTLNDKQHVEELEEYSEDESCPTRVAGSFDNSLYSPLVKRDTPLSIAAVESCRVLPLNYQRDEEYEGFQTYRFSLLKVNQTPPACLARSYNVPLHDGMFDVSHCVINKASSAFSMPHFYGTSYNWSQHFEGFSPNAEEHEPFILLEPTTGIPIKEKYRFQTCTALPDLSFSPKLRKLSHMFVPGFWYEFDMDQLPGFVSGMIRFIVKVVPTLQPILMALQLIAATWCLLSVVRRLCGFCSYAQLYRKICGTANVQLETVLNSKPQHDFKCTTEQAVK